MRNPCSSSCLRAFVAQSLRISKKSLQFLQGVTQCTPKFHRAHSKFCWEFLSSEGVGKRGLDDTRTWGEVLLTPSWIYSPMICTLLDAGFQLKGIAHITGGGLVGNFERITEVTGVGAVLDNLFEPLEMMQKLMGLGKISPETAYKYWNMGNGMLFVVDKSEVHPILQKIEASGYTAKAAGKITSEKKITIATETQCS